MYLDLKMASGAQFDEQSLDRGVGVWGKAEASTRAEAYAIVDEIWDAIEKKANELQGSQS